MVRGSKARKTMVNGVYTPCLLSKYVATSMEKRGQLGDLLSVPQPCNDANKVLQNNSIESVQTAQEVHVSGNDVVAMSATTGPGSVNDSQIVNEPVVDTFPLPNVDIVADLFGVPLKSLMDIDVLTRRIEVGECEYVMMAMTSVERIAAMGVTEAIWKKILAENSSDYPPLPIDTSVPHENNLTVVTCDHMGLHFTYSTNDSIPNGNNESFNSFKEYSPNGITNTMKGMENVLENGPWMICNSPIILKKWTMNTSLFKEELTRIPVWVKLHDVPVQVFSEDGISLIATQIAPKVSTFAKDDPSKKMPAKKGGPHVPTCKPSVPISNPYDVLDDMKR
ncbi:zinc knuckle CX2CX4HX4C containing protein [Tanacetum coccineum]